MACEGVCAPLELAVKVAPEVRPILKRSLLGDGESGRDKKRPKTVRFGEDESFYISPRKVLHDDPPSMFSTCYEIASQQVSLFVQNILNKGDVHEIEKEDADSEACDDFAGCAEHPEVTG